MSSRTEWEYKGPRAADVTSGVPRGEERTPGANWLLFAGVMLALVGILNVIYGIAAISKSHFYDGNADYVVSSLRTYGWTGVVLGGAQLLAATSIWRGGSFGRWFGLVAASLSAIEALMSISGYPFLSLALFAVDVLIIYGLTAYGGQHRAV